jgi:hypothetical protein
MADADSEIFLDPYDTFVGQEYDDVQEILSYAEYVSDGMGGEYEVWSAEMVEEIIRKGGRPKFHSVDAVYAVNHGLREALCTFVQTNGRLVGKVTCLVAALIRIYPESRASHLL